ncbi:unnamed protein product, partial [Rotaria sp. Silwood2]
MISFSTAKPNFAFLAISAGSLSIAGMQPEFIGRNEYSRYDQIDHFPGWRDMN